MVHNQKDEGVESQSIDCATECSYTSPQVAERSGGGYFILLIKTPRGGVKV